jgi:DNA repair protein RecO (recombination protein O)
VIREQSVGEYDRLITVLTAQHGLVKAFCRGAKKAKSKKLSATALLTYSEFTFNKTKDAFTVGEAEVREVFFELRQDVVKMALAQYLCELAYEFCEEDYESEEILRLFLNSLYLLKRNKKSASFVKAVTEFRLMSLAGYMPRLIACDNCDEYETAVMGFDKESGKLYCENCLPGYALKIPSSVVKAMRHVALSDFEKIFSFTLSEDNIKIFENLTEDYLLDKTARKFKTLDFYNVIKE